jgi:surface protein
MRARSVGVDRGWLGSQAFGFQGASAFNADIGAWNTARVSNMLGVCAAFPAWAARLCKRDALGGCSMWRGPLCAAATADALARVCADVWARACAGVHMWRCSCV